MLHSSVETGRILKSKIFMGGSSEGALKLLPFLFQIVREIRHRSSGRSCPSNWIREPSMDLVLRIYMAARYPVLLDSSPGGPHSH